MIVYTSIYGGYDHLQAHPSCDSVESWICYTDSRTLSAPGWDIVYEEPRYEHPRLSAKWRKCHPPSCTRSLWLDGCVALTNPTFIDVVCELLTRDDIAMFQHPERTNIRDEARASLELCPEKYGPYDLEGQVAHYARTRQLQEHLWASTVIGRVHSERVLQMGAAWMAHCELLTYQDQLSLPILLDDYNISVGIIEGTLESNSWLTWEWGWHLRRD